MNDASLDSTSNYKNINLVEHQWWQSKDDTVDAEDTASHGREQLNDQITDMLDLHEGLGVFLLLNLVKELITAPVETYSGEVLIQPMLLSLMTERCLVNSGKLADLGLFNQVNPAILKDPLYNFTLEPRWFSWLSPKDSFDGANTSILESEGARVMLKILGSHLVAVKTMSLRSQYLEVENMPVLADAFDSCTRVLSRYLWRKAGFGIKSLFKIPALYKNRGEVLELTFDADTLGRAFFLSGLERSPGYVPWLGKDVQFRFHERDWV